MEWLIKIKAYYKDWEVVGIVVSRLLGVHSHKILAKNILINYINNIMFKANYLIMSIFIPKVLIWLWTRQFKCRIL